MANNYRVSGMRTAQVRELQRSLGVTADGAWGKQSQAALEARYGAGADPLSVYKNTYTANSAYTDGNTAGQNSPSANASAGWPSSDAVRKIANDAWLTKSGIDPSARYQWDDKRLGAMGADGTGGVFNPDGYSSNPYFLQTATGVSREQLKGTVAEALSDKAIWMALQQDPMDLMQGMKSYVTYNGSMVSNQPGVKGVDVLAVRNAVADARGFAPTVSVGMGRIPTPLDKVDQKQVDMVAEYIEGLRQKQENAASPIDNYLDTYAPGGGEQAEPASRRNPLAEAFYDKELERYLQRLLAGY